MTRAMTVPKHRTGIPGFDLISEGGLPRARATLVAGSATTVPAQPIAAIWAGI